MLLLLSLAANSPAVVVRAVISSSVPRSSCRENVVVDASSSADGDSAVGVAATNATHATNRAKNRIGSPRPISDIFIASNGLARAAQTTKTYRRKMCACVYISAAGGETFGRKKKKTCDDALWWWWWWCNYATRIAYHAFYVGRVREARAVFCRCSGFERSGIMTSASRSFVCAQYEKEIKIKKRKGIGE